MQNEKFVFFIYQEWVGSASLQYFFLYNYMKRVANNVYTVWGVGGGRGAGSLGFFGLNTRGQ